MATTLQIIELWQGIRRTRGVCAGVGEGWRGLLVVFSVASLHCHRMVASSSSAPVLRGKLTIFILFLSSHLATRGKSVLLSEWRAHRLSR